MKELLKQFNPLTGDFAEVLQVFIIVFLVLLFNYFLKLFLNKIKRKLADTRNLWDDAFIDALIKPTRLAIWILGLSFAAEIVVTTPESAFFDLIEPARVIGVIGSITWFLVKFISGVEKNILAKDPEIDKTTADAITRLLRISVIITAILVVLQTLGFSISGVLAFGGVGGIAIGFAAKDLLANFFGGLLIFLERPFSVGDWVRSPDRNIEGTVEKIGWRLTVIRTFDKRPLYIPNAVFNSIALENPSRMTHRRIYETIGVRYDDAGKIGPILEDVRKMLKEHPEIDASQTLMVNFNEFGPSSLDFFIYTFTKTTVWTKYHEIKEDVLKKIISIIEAHGAEFAFPTSTIHIPNEIHMETGK